MFKSLPIIIGLSVALAGLTAYHKVAMWRADKRQEAAVATMANVMRTKQNKAQKEANEYVEKIDSLSDRVANYKRLYNKAKLPSNCPTSAPTEASGQDGQGDRDGNFIAETFDYSFRAEQDRLTLLDCQKFIREIME